MKIFALCSSAALIGGTIAVSPLCTQVQVNMNIFLTVAASALLIFMAWWVYPGAKKQAK